MDDFARALSSHADKYRKRPTHQVLLDAAEDVRLQTTKLIAWSLDPTQDERLSNESEEGLPLLILQQRADDEVLSASFALLEAGSSLERILGAKILRELPCLDQAPYPHSLAAIEALGKLVAVEEDEAVLTWALSAVGWQRHPSGLDVLLGCLSDDRADVRRTVGDNLLKSCLAGDVIPPRVASALLQLACDDDADIRWSVFYDVAESPEFFRSCQQTFCEAAARAQNDPMSNVREQARRAHAELSRLGGSHVA